MKAILAMMLIASAVALAYEGESDGYREREIEIKVKREESMLERVHRYDEQRQMEKLIRIEEERLRHERSDKWSNRDSKK